MLYKCFVFTWTLTQRWANILSPSETTAQHLMNIGWTPHVCCLPPIVVLMVGQRLRRWTSIETTFGRRFGFTGICCTSGFPYPEMPLPANTIHSNNVGIMLGQRLRRWPNIKPTLSADPTRSTSCHNHQKPNTMLVQCRTNLTNFRPALSQCWVDALRHLPETDHRSLSYNPIAL